MNNLFTAKYELGYLDELSRRTTTLHSLDPRAKLLTTLAFLCCVVSFDRYAVAPLIPFFLYPAVVGGLAGISAGYLARRLLVVLPFALLLGIFNPLLDRQPVLLFNSLEISAGWFSFLSILLRAVLTVSAALILIAATGMQNLCAALDRLRAPRVFIVQLLFLYRYLFVLAEEALNMVRARDCRSAGRRNGSLHSYGALTGHLLLRTYERAERIHSAMTARGFAGEVKPDKPLVFSHRDALFLFGWLCFFLFLRLFNPTVVLGGFFTGGGR